MKYKVLKSNTFETSKYLRKKSCLKIPNKGCNFAV